MGFLARACNSGIYAIRNCINGSLYIGSTSSFQRRFTDHARFLRTQKHGNAHLQSAWLKYGADAFEFLIIEYIDDNSRLIEREQVWMNFFHPTYNLCKIAGNTLGRRHSEDAKKRLSEAGKNRSAETRLRMSISAKIRTASGGADLVSAMTAANLGNKRRAGVLHTTETKLKMSVASKGRPKSPEHRAKLAALCTARNIARSAVA